MNNFFAGTRLCVVTYEKCLKILENVGLMLWGPYYGDPSHEFCPYMHAYSFIVGCECHGITLGSTVSNSAWRIILESAPQTLLHFILHSN